MGNINTFVNYLCAKKPRLQSYMPREHAQKSYQYLNWFQAVMRPCIQRLVKTILGPRAFGLDYEDGDEVEAIKSDFLENICNYVESMLKDRKFLITKNEPTAIDIIFYNEISAAFILCRIKGLKRKYPLVTKWIDMMGDITELAHYDDKLVEMVENYELEW